MRDKENLSLGKNENKRFCQRHKHEKEKINASVNDISMEKINFYASERLRNTKEEFLNDFFYFFCFYTKKCHVNHTAFLFLK